MNEEALAHWGAVSPKEKKIILSILLRAICYRMELNSIDPFQFRNSFVMEEEEILLNLKLICIVEFLLSLVLISPAPPPQQARIRSRHTT